MGFFIASIQKHNWYLYIDIVACDLVELLDSCLLSAPLHQAAFWPLSKVGLRAAVVSSSVQEYRSYFFLGPPVKLPKLSIWGIPFNYPGCPANLHASHTFWKSSIHSRDLSLKNKLQIQFFFNFLESCLLSACSTNRGLLFWTCEVNHITAQAASFKRMMTRLLKGCILDCIYLPLYCSSESRV